MGVLPAENLFCRVVLRTYFASLILLKSLSMCMYLSKITSFPTKFDASFFSVLVVYLRILLTHALQVFYAPGWGLS